VDIDGDGDNDLLAACETDTRLVWWGAASINDPPVNSVPGDQSVEKDVDLTFNSANSNLTWIFAPPTPLRN
jgi:hypothetical protein